MPQTSDRRLRYGHDWTPFAPTSAVSTDKWRMILIQACIKCLEAGFGFSIASGEAAKLLEFAEAAFDAVAQSVKGFVVIPLLFAIAARRNHGLGLHRLFHMCEDLGSR
jgi:hypothetical protein